MTPEDFNRRLRFIDVPLDRRGADAMGVPIQAFLQWSRGVQPIPPEAELAVEALEAKRREWDDQFFNDIIFSQ